VTDLNLAAIKARADAAYVPNWLADRPSAAPVLASAADVPALLARIADYVAALRRAGIEYPTDPRGIDDLAAMASGRLEELTTAEARIAELEAERDELFDGRMLARRERNVAEQDLEADLSDAHHEGFGAGMESADRDIDQIAAAAERRGYGRAVARLRDYADLLVRRSGDLPAVDVAWKLCQILDAVKESTDG